MVEKSADLQAKARLFETEGKTQKKILKQILEGNINTHVGLRSIRWN